MSDGTRTGATSERLSKLCCFFLGGEEYAVDIMRIVEILQVPKVSAVPSSTPLLEGMVNLRGAILPVVDLRKWLGLGLAPPKLKPKLLVCLVGRRRLGLLVDGVTGVVRVRRSELKPAPAPSAPEPGARPFVIGVCDKGGKLRLLFDVKAFLEHPPLRPARSAP